MTQQNVEYKLHIADGFYSVTEILAFYLQARTAQETITRSIKETEIKDIMKGDK